MTPRHDWIDILEVLRPGEPAAPRPSERLRERLLAATRQASRFEGFIDRLAALIGGTSDQARQLVEQIDRRDSWIESTIPGHRFMPVLGYGAAAADALKLVWVESGHPFPMHSHPTDELSFCIQGGARICEDLVLEPGDFLVIEAGQPHGGHSLEGEPCIMLLRRKTF